LLELDRRMGVHTMNATILRAMDHRLTAQALVPRKQS
jgi:hypothetical protein